MMPMTMNKLRGLVTKRVDTVIQSRMRKTKKETTQTPKRGQTKGRRERCSVRSTVERTSIRQRRAVKRVLSRGLPNSFLKCGLKAALFKGNKKRIQI